MGQAGFLIASGRPASAQLSTLFPLITWKKIQSYRKKYIHILHIKLVIPSAVLKGQMQPSRSTSSSVHAAFCLAACACWGSSAERKSYCAPTDVPCQKCQMVKAQKHFVPKRSFPLSCLGSCLQHWEQASALLKQAEKGSFFNWREKIQAQSSHHLQLAPSHSLHNNWAPQTHGWMSCFIWRDLKRYHSKL